MYFISILLLCNYCYAAEQSFDYDISFFTAPSEYYQEIEPDSLNSVKHSSQCTSTASSITRPPKSNDNPCPYCPRQIKGTFFHLTHHIALLHTICNICSPRQPFFNRGQLYDHLHNEHLITASWIHALKSDKSARHKDTMYLNQFTYQNQTTSRSRCCYCNACNREIERSITAIEYHMATAHQQCIRCAGTPLFNTSDDVQSHYKEFHANLHNTLLIAQHKHIGTVFRKPRSSNPTNTKVFICPIGSCNKTIKGSVKNYHQHLAIVHARCSRCNDGIEYATDDALITHLSTEHKKIKHLITYLSNRNKTRSCDASSHNQELYSDISYGCNNNHQQLSDNLIQEPCINYFNDDQSIERFLDSC